MAPLIVLILTFAILAALNRYIVGGKLGVSMTGRIAMAAMLLLTSISHFSSADIMVEMMPDFLPLQRELVYFTGICELAAVVGLIWNKTSRLTSVMLIILFILILPANIVGSLNQVNLGGMEYGAIYLLFRVPLQIFFIWWVWFFGLRLNYEARPEPE